MAVQHPSNLAALLRSAIWAKRETYKSVIKQHVELMEQVPNMLIPMPTTKFLVLQLIVNEDEEAGLKQEQRRKI